MPVTDVDRIGELLTDFPVTVEVPVAWGDMDALGHVNNAVYFRYFETARIRFFAELDWARSGSRTAWGRSCIRPAVGSGSR